MSSSPDCILSLSTPGCRLPGGPILNGLRSISGDVDPAFVALHGGHGDLSAGGMTRSKWSAMSGCGEVGRKRDDCRGVRVGSANRCPLPAWQGRAGRATVMLAVCEEASVSVTEGVRSLGRWRASVMTGKICFETQETTWEAPGTASVGESVYMISSGRLFGGTRWTARREAKPEKTTRRRAGKTC